MRYVKVRWLSNSPSDPISLYSELDDAGWEIRKVEEFADGKISFASRTSSTGTTRLGDVAVPSIEAIAKEPEFFPSAITGDEFERVWRRATSA